MLLQHLLDLRRALQLRQFLSTTACFGKGCQCRLFVHPLARRALGHQLPAGQLNARLQQFDGHLAGVPDPALQQVDAGQGFRKPEDVDRLDILALGALNGAVDQRADRLGSAPAAVVASCQRCVRPLRGLDGHDQLGLEAAHPVEVRHPAPHMRRLHDDHLDRLDALEGPACRLGAKCGSRVEECLRVLFSLDRHAVAKLPVQQNAAIANPANKIGGTKNTRESVAKAHHLLDRVFQLSIRVDLIQHRQRGQQLALQPVLRQLDAVVHQPKELLGPLGRLQNGGDDVVQQRALVGVAAGRLGRHLLHKRDAAGARDDALGGRAADDVRVLGHTVVSCCFVSRYRFLVDLSSIV